MRVWWCEEHEASGDGSSKERYCTLGWTKAKEENCRMVEYDLHPAGSRVVSGEALPELLWWINSTEDMTIQELVDLLDALADKEAGL